MYNVKITAIRKANYTDLQAQYENPIEHTCDVHEGQQWTSIDGEMPEGMCESAWESMRVFVEALSRGDGNFFDGWMQNPFSAMISCNDGFRPVSFLLERQNEQPSIHHDTNTISLWVGWISSLVFSPCQSERVPFGHLAYRKRSINSKYLRY